MKLSEAIRLGAMLKPQGAGSGSAKPHADATCALGAAIESAGLSYDHDFTSVRERWPFVSAVRLACPLRDERTIYQHGMVCHTFFAQSRQLLDLIWHLNDAHGWSRERIADWVESIERQQEPLSQPSVEQPEDVWVG